MADRGDTHYFGPTLHKWFFFSSALLMLSVVWMVIDDWNASWKNYQREFRDIDAQLARRQLEQASMQEARDMERRLQEQLDDAVEGLDASADDIAAAEELLDEYREARRVADEAAKTVKQNYNWEKYLFEEHRLHGHASEDDERMIVELEAEMHRTAQVYEEATATWEAQGEVLAALRSSVSDLETQISAATKDLALVQTRLDTLDPQTAPEQLADIIRDFPGLDFVEPNLRVQKVLPPNLTVELNFSLGARIDMCTTCHMGMERPAFADQPQPYSTHPRLDLFLTAKSPHPYNEVGCTICHRGAGQALDFQHSDHRPSFSETVWVKDGVLVEAGTDGAEELTETEWWRQEHHWHKQHHWDTPMLSSEYTEASCTQCHKDSMELIAPEAPAVTEGYRNFERYGCYACHKVDWFPTTRKPGPSLQALSEKLTPEFTASWIAKPRDFRPSTWMPQVFHLENFAPEAAVVQQSEWGQGGPILGQAWNDTAVAAVTAYLYDQDRPRQVRPIPEGLVGDPGEGRDLFRIVGCLACHNVSEYGSPDADELYADGGDAWHVVADPEGDYIEHLDVDPATLRNGENEHGPNLRGVNTKLNADWLFRWIQNPSSYWPETRMPDLRLSDQEAADIVAYMMEDPDGYFSDTPDDWVVAAAPVDRAALEEQARWFFMREGRAEIESRFESGGMWGDDQSLLVAVGEKFVMNQGCYSCHTINGHENDMPIGAELSTWGTKTVDKLDFGFIANHMQNDLGWSFDEREEFKAYREGWIEQKLRAPRSYDRQKIKNPSEKLRMPWFDFDEETLRSIAIFVVGLVEDEVDQARMIPTPEQLARDHGLRAIRQKNCAACHVIEPGLLTFLDEDGNTREVEGHFGILDEEFSPVPQDGRWDDYLSSYSEILRYYGEDEETASNYDVYFDVWRPEPDLELDAGGTAVVPYGNIVDYREPWGGDFVAAVTDYYQYYYNRGSEAEGIGEVNGTVRDPSQDEYFDIRWPFAPPVLHREGTKLQQEWFYEFLLNPQPIRRQMRVRMPTFTYAPGEAESIAEYFAQQAVVDYPAWYARKMRLEAEMSTEEVSNNMRASMGLSVSSDAIAAIEQGSVPDIEANFSRLAQYYREGESVQVWPDLHYWPSVAPGYEVQEHRSRARREALQQADPEYFARAHALIQEPAGADPTDVKGVNCVQCHWLLGEPPTLNRDSPLAWAPDLAYVRERLREDWVQEWLINPPQVYPNTKMPANFVSDTSYQEAFPGTAAAQVHAVLDWLYNMDFVHTMASQ